MQTRSKRLGTLARHTFVAVVAVALSGCFHYYPPTAPKGGTDVDTLEALFKCQEKVAKAGAKLASTINKSLNKCVQKPFAAQLAFENGLIASEIYDTAILEGTADCEKPFGKIFKASTKYVDNGLKNCTDVADAILGDYDALRMTLAASSVAGGAPPEDLEDVFGRLCGVQAVLAQGPAVAAFPRMLEMMNVLLPGIVVDESSPPTEEDPTAIAVLQLLLDERCTPVFEGRSLASLVLP